MLERESSVFKAMFSSPSPSEGQNGESNEKPINIPGVSHSEFEALLDFLDNG
jgi:BTB/POZ domain